MSWKRQVIHSVIQNIRYCRCNTQLCIFAGLDRYITTIGACNQCHALLHQKNIIIHLAMPFCQIVISLVN